MAAQPHSHDPSGYGDSAPYTRELFSVEICQLPGRMAIATIGKTWQNFTRPFLVVHLPVSQIAGKIDSGQFHILQNISCYWPWWPINGNQCKGMLLAQCLSHLKSLSAATQLHFDSRFSFLKTCWNPPHQSKSRVHISIPTPFGCNVAMAAFCQQHYSDYS